MSMFWSDHVIRGLSQHPWFSRLIWGAYTFFAVFCLLSLTWAYFFVPETSGRTLEQMDMVFKDVSGEEETTRQAAIEGEILSSNREVTEGDEGGVASSVDQEVFHSNQK